MSGPEIWGPHGWKFIHFITLGYPNLPTNEEKQKYFNFFYSLQYVIPCSSCGENFKKHLELYPLTDEILSNKIKFINWGIKMHNLTNYENNKKILSFDNAYRLILNNQYYCNPKKISLKNIMFFLFTVIIILILIKKKYNVIYNNVQS